MTIMKIEYTRAELCLKHYLWNAGLSEESDEYEFDGQVLDILQGYEVLVFANTFLNRYLPGHTVEQLHELEHALIEHLPHNLKTRGDIANWLAGNLMVVPDPETNFLNLYI